jgi:hypothetical protein
MTEGIPQMALSMSKKIKNTLNSTVTHMTIIIRNIKSSMSMTQNSIIKAQALKSRDTRKSRTNRNTPRMESLERAKMNIRRNDGPVSRPWKVNLS